jgi:hypothetical protein
MDLIQWFNGDKNFGIMSRVHKHLRNHKLYIKYMISVIIAEMYDK